MNNAPQITAATIDCMGCRTQGAKFVFCSQMCPIRKCVRAKGFSTCAECEKLEDCPTVNPIFRQDSSAKQNLRLLRG